MEYIYFVSFGIVQGSQHGFGNSTIKRGRKVNGIEDIASMQKEIIEHHNLQEGSVTILNYQLIEG